jgi:hypothetical protein
MFQLDGILIGFLFLSSSSVFQLGFGFGRTIFKFPNIAKPYPLVVRLHDQGQMQTIAAFGIERYQITIAQQRGEQIQKGYFFY